LVACVSLLLVTCKKNEPIDEAKAAGLTTADFPQITADIFKLMDGGIHLLPEEIMGRNTWNLWSGGNQRFWNLAAQESFGIVDLLKMLDNRKYPRGERFKTLGVVNEPGFRPATKPDEFGLWLDEQIEPEPAGIAEKLYGKPSGVLGYRLFPNPAFNDEARKKWNGNRFMNDPTYYKDSKLIRPYRVGVACVACHIAPYPGNPPADPENPGWENLASAIGNQYINEGKVFACNVEKGGFFYEELAAQPRGTSDTSRIATDHINNPNAINAIFLLAERERIAASEKMADGTLALPCEKQEMRVPHVLKDGADSVGVPGAILRVYVNIGVFSEYWLTRHNALIGLTPQKPFEIPYARDHSVFWRATEERTPNIAAFFRKLRSFHLADAPGGQAYLTKNEAVMTHGKQVFAESCASCHSSKQPPPNIDPTSQDGKAWFRAAVMAPDFLKDNFLSNDKRYPISKIGTNSARAFATNANAGHVWDNFSSQTYKGLLRADQLEFFNPFDETRPIKFKPKDKNAGPGYYRVPSLVSLWSSAPFLHNNMLGKFTGDPSVAGRMQAFDDAVAKLLWPENRAGKSSIWRTNDHCWIRISKDYLPWVLRLRCDKDGYLNVGPIPAGTPINLIANLELGFGDLLTLVPKIKADLYTIHNRNLDDEAAKKVFANLVPDLIKASKCPDFIEDRGHEFGCNLPDQDKYALIEYLKTF